MLKRLIRRVNSFRAKRTRGLSFGVFLAGGALTGLASVLFMWAFEFALKHSLQHLSFSNWDWVITPLAFLLSIELIRKIAPFADGAGIPQTVFAATHMTESSKKQILPLVSLKTMSVKIIALLLAVWAGASTGREGPTVHVAACLFLGVILFAQFITKKKFNLRSAIVAGGAAGLAAAFNTPLAGVTFAIEELSGDYFASMKESVLLAIILAGITAQFLTGEYAYFGQLIDPAPVNMGTVILIGLCGGLSGAFFSTLLIKGRKWVVKSSVKPVTRFGIPILFSLGLLGLNRISFFPVTGPGNEVAQQLLEGQFEKDAILFPGIKMMATLLTYWSGIAGGIFAPCLSTGAGMGASIGYWTMQSTQACALIGMAAFLGGTIQAPITAFVIIFEMTGYHNLLLPIMLASLVAMMTARVFGAKHLYQTLAKSYGDAIDSSQFPKSGASRH